MNDLRRAESLGQTEADRVAAAIVRAAVDPRESINTRVADVNSGCAFACGTW